MKWLRTSDTNWKLNPGPSSLANKHAAVSSIWLTSLLFILSKYFYNDNGYKLRYSKIYVTVKTVKD